MSEVVDLRNGIGRKELQLIRRRFVNLHKERQRRIEKELSPHQREFMQLLPLLFHINHPTLPGFVGTDTPAGIPDFTPSQAMLRTARKLSRSFSYRKRALRSYPIQGIYFMGSIGSIAHSEQSDFDIWLCHDPELNPNQYQALCEKVAKLETWADEMGLEVHIFVMDVDSFRQGDRAALSAESSGSTQQRLLLEEFYRTGVLMAGRFPLWWLVPPEEERNYTDYVRMLVEKRFINPADCLDFGGLELFPAYEFFGAARWHLYKGIESPYKSVLKILLMEAYSQEYPNIPWLSLETKAAIYSGIIDITKLDPYVMLYRRLEHYLMDRDELDRLALAQRCFYFKTGLKLSRRPQSQKGKWKRELMQSIIEGWGWSNADLETLDSRSSWKIDRVMEERNILVRELFRSYRLLENFSREQFSDHIDQAELSLLRRKLRSALDRRPGKIDRVNPGISTDLGEERLSLHFVPRQSGEDGWMLYRGEVNEKKCQQAKPLKSTVGLMEMLAWCHLNHICNRGSAISIYPTECSVARQEVHALLDALRNLFPLDSQPVIPLATLKQPPHVASSALFVNIGADPFAHLLKQGKQLASDRSNPFSFGATHSNLLINLEQLIYTSWGELLAQRYDGVEGLFDCLCQYLQLVFQAPAGTPYPKLSAHGFSSTRAGSVARRLEELFQDAIHCFTNDGAGEDARFLVEVGDEYYLIQKEEETFRWVGIGDISELLDALATPLSRYRTLEVDRLTLQGSPLSEIFTHNQKGSIQVFFHNQQAHTELFILDEHGALFHQKVHGGDEHHLLVQQQRFFDGLLHWQLLVSSPYAQDPYGDPEYFRLTKSHEGAWHANKQSPPKGRIPETYLELRLISEGTDLGRKVFTLICHDQEFNAFELGDQLYSTVAKSVLKKRSHRQNYPIYLTGVEISGPDPAHEGSTIELLNMKKHLEARLNQALDDLLINTLP